ncbi:MAG: DEAD/DEAH box helicase [Rhizobiaceae bacterium]|nr:MAG: DEAD/DEAH box helicase [Rhizobiaceae bacterium]
MTNSADSGSETVRPSSGFALLAEPVQRWIWEKGWTALRDIQERAIPILIGSDDDVIISAATAGGKTEAAFLPLISRTLREGEKRDGFDLVYVGPLKALINDQFARLDDLCERAEIPVHRWHGDVSQSAKLRARKNPKGILLITPESLEAMFVLRGLEIPHLFGKASAIVIDELHALLDTERGIHLRSLLTRLEIAVARRIRRVGLSATLGDMSLARAYLRPDAADQVKVLESHSDGQELRLQLRGQLIASPANADPRKEEAATMSANRAIATHIFDRLRGSRNLIFAGSRQRVEVFADLLAWIAQERGVPNEFLPHHANLSRDHRTFVEERLKTGTEPTSAICTSTLELGIDIGEVETVAQIGAPFSVASLRQRLGRSGRRAGHPAVLRMYVAERELTAEASPADKLRLQLVRAIATIDLLIEGWCEPPRPLALHLSTLLHQILSVIASRGGTRASMLFAILCEKGPFRHVDQAVFVRLLRHTGSPDVELIEQSPDGTLLLGRKGERLVEHYSFYAVFQTPEEYRVMSDGRALGTLPMLMPLAPGMTIIFSGRRWKVTHIHDRERMIEVVPDPTGVPPEFGGDVGMVDDVVVERMRTILMEDAPRQYLDATAGGLLQEARDSFRRLRLDKDLIVQTDEKSALLATWAGTAKTESLALALRAEGLEVEIHDGLIEVSGDLQSIIGTLNNLATGEGLSDILKDVSLPLIEKYHAYLPPDLLLTDELSSRIDLDAIPHLARRLLDTPGADQ